MDLKEKELLLKDLSSRLFYNPWVQFNLEYGDNGHKEGLYKAHISSIDPTSGWLEVDYFETETLEKEWSSTIENIKPYLRSLYNMTEEERKELELLVAIEVDNAENEDEDASEWCLYDRTGILNAMGGARFYFDEMIHVYDWLYQHHFDFRGLISLGLAIEAPKGMY
jgi:hypothetical protein